MGSTRGMGVGVLRDVRGAARFVDIRRRLSSGEDLFEELAALEQDDDEVLARCNADFEPQSLVDAARYSNKFRLIRSSDGEVSDVLHRQDPSDRSARSDAFEFHNDGLYLNSPPYYCALYCLNPGDSDIPTVFVESSKILSKLAVAGISLQLFRRCSKRI
jgi:Taurine catabolism dioxygenase TauD, TfdA family